MSAKIVKEETRARLLKAALEVFSRDGLDGATTHDIAEVAGVNEVTLFRHFKSKRQLLTEVVQCHCEEYDPMFAQAKVESWDDIRATITQFVERTNAFSTQYEHFIRAIIGEVSREPELAKQMFAASRYKRELLTTYLGEGQKRGLIRPDIDLKSTVAVLQSMILGYTIRRPLLEPEMDRNLYLKSALELFFRGIAA